MRFMVPVPEIWRPRSDRRPTDKKKCRPRNVRAPSLRLDVGRADHVAPFFSFVSDELCKIGRRAAKHHTAQLGKPRLRLGIGEASVYLLVQLVYDRGRCAFRYNDAIPLARLKPGHEFAHSGQIWERVSAHGTRHRKRLQLASSDVLDCCGNATEYHLHLSAE